MRLAKDEMKKHPEGLQGITIAVTQVSVPPFKQHRDHCSSPESIQNMEKSPQVQTHI